jgi:hypothetical protein
MRTLRGWAISFLDHSARRDVRGVVSAEASQPRQRPDPVPGTFLRAGHAHGGVLLLMSLLYYMFLDQTSLSASLKRAASLVLFAGVLAQAGGFFLHAIVGQPDEASIGTAITLGGAVLLASALVVLVYGLITTR